MENQSDKVVLYVKLDRHLYGKMKNLSLKKYRTLKKRITLTEIATEAIKLYLEVEGENS